MRGWGSFGPAKRSRGGSCCSLGGKLLLGCVSHQPPLFCRPKAFSSSVRCCYHLQSHIKTVFVLRFDFPPTENSKSTQGYLRGGGEGRFQMLGECLCSHVGGLGD